MARPQSLRRRVGQACRRTSRHSAAAKRLVFVTTIGVSLVVSAQPTTANVTKNAARPTPAKEAAAGTVTVFAAASLNSAFTEIAGAFETANPKAKVKMQFAGSSTLVTQLLNGAQADVVAAADSKSLEKLTRDGLLAGAPVVFARNSLMIVVPKGNPRKVNSLADFGRSELVFAIGAPGVPAGDYARAALQRVGVTAQPASFESNVKSIVTKAGLGEIDAGIVYRTDVEPGNKRIEGVVIPASQNVLAKYPVATLREAANAASGRAFIQFLKSPTAVTVLKKHNFLSP